MDLNLEPKFGGKPEFNPVFVNNVVRTVLSAENTLTTSEVAAMVNEEDEKKFSDKMDFGQRNGFWEINKDSIVMVGSVDEFSEQNWTPLRFANYLVDAMCSRHLGDPENWNSFAALIAWSYSLRTSVAEQSGGRVLELSNKWSDFEKYGISTGLSIRDKDGSGLVTNETQWNVTRKWMQAIGSFVQFHGFKIPSSYLLNQRLKIIIQGSTEKMVPVRETVKSLREVLPFLPGGVYGKMWYAYLESQWSKHDFSANVEKDQENVLTQQESMAFLVLESAGMITLRDINDAGDRFFTSVGSRGDRRPVSHIQILVGEDD